MISDEGILLVTGESWLVISLTFFLLRPQPHPAILGSLDTSALATPLGTGFRSVGSDGTGTDLASWLENIPDFILILIQLLPCPMEQRLSEDPATPQISNEGILLVIGESYKE